MSTKDDAYGIIAEFGDAEDLLRAAERVRGAGYTRLEAFSPFPIDGLAETIGMRANRVSLTTLLGGVCGGGFAYFMLYYINVIDYPLNVGGRPLHSWPAFIPITFELTVLFAAFGALLGMLILNRLPQPYHPVFAAKNFQRASQDRFFLLIEIEDPLFDLEPTSELLHAVGACDVSLVPPADDLDAQTSE